MKNNSAVTVSLYSADSSEINTVRVCLNRNGQLPVVLIDPLDTSGRVVSGLWLSREADGTAFFWAQQDRENKTGLRRGGRTLTSVALHGVDDHEIAAVPLPFNRNGQLPVVLIDPVDDKGRVIKGLWLGNGLGGTVYRSAGQSKDPTLSERREADIMQPAEFVEGAILGGTP